MPFDDPAFQAFAEEQAAAVLAELGYVPVRKLPWRDAQPQGSLFEDPELESDVRKLHAGQAELVNGLTGLKADVDSFSLPLSGETTSLSFNEVIVAAQSFLLRGINVIVEAKARYHQVANETPSAGSRLTAEDLAYARTEMARRTELAKQILDYCRDPGGTTSPPRKPSGEVISPVLAGGLAHHYAANAAELSARLDAEDVISATDQIGDALNRVAGLVGASGSEFLRDLAARLEKARRRGLRWRGYAVTTLSLALMVIGAFLDKLLGRMFGDVLLLSLAAAALFWTYDRLFSTFVEGRVRKWRLEVIADAVDSMTGWLIFLRRQEDELNRLRVSVGKPAVKLADNWPGRV